MKSVHRAAVLVVVISIATFFLGKLIWPPELAAVKPETQMEQMFFFSVSVIESILFGIGFAFFYLMLPTFKKALKMKHWPTMLSIPSLTWMFLNWWPHDNMHLYLGSKMESLIFIEGFFHGSMILAIVIVAFSYYRAVTGEESAR